MRFFSLEAGLLVTQLGQLGGDGRQPFPQLLGEVLPAHVAGAGALPFILPGLQLELLDLQVEPLARGRDLGDGAAQPGQRLQQPPVGSLGAGTDRLVGRHRDDERRAEDGSPVPQGRSATSARTGLRRPV